MTLRWPAKPAAGRATPLPRLPPIGQAAPSPWGEGGRGASGADARNRRAGPPRASRGGERLRQRNGAPTAVSGPPLRNPPRRRPRMTRFRIRYTGDYLDATGAVGVGDIALDLYDGVPFIDTGFLRDQSPTPGDPTYWDRLYSLELTPAHVAARRRHRHLPPLGQSRRLRRRRRHPHRHRPRRRRHRQDRPRRLHRQRRRRLQRPRHAHPRHRLLRLPPPPRPREDASPSSRRSSTPPAGTSSRRPWAPTSPARPSASSASAPAAASSPASPPPGACASSAFSPHADPAAAAALGVELVPTLEALLAEADFVSLHNRLDPTTRGLIGAAELALHETHRLLHQRRPRRDRRPARPRPRPARSPHRRRRPRRLRAPSRSPSATRSSPSTTSSSPRTGCPRPATPPASPCR